MNKKLFFLITVFTVGMIVYLDPTLSFAQSFGGGGFESRVNSLTQKLISFILPAIGALGLVYAAILASMGDEGAKKRMVLVIIASIVGCLAPMIIRWMQSAAGGM